MMSTMAPSGKPHSHFVEGLQFPAMFKADAIRSAIHYKARPDDLFVVTYPKCGTTWAQHILMLIYSSGEPLTDVMKFTSATPFLERTGAEGAELMSRPGSIKLHLPFRLTPWNDSAKYIYVARNPRDCCVSYFHHMRSFQGHGFNGTFEEFFDIFISGELDFGDYFDHLLGWYEHRNKPNVLFLTYEELKEHTKETILKMASFIDEDSYAKPLREDPEKLANVVKYSSFDHMKEVLNKRLFDIASMSIDDIQKSDMPDRMKTHLEVVKQQIHGQEKPPNINFIRKGIIGDWRNHFTEEQIKRLDKKYLLKTKGTDIPKLWNKYM